MAKKTKTKPIAVLLLYVLALGVLFVLLQGKDPFFKNTQEIPGEESKVVNTKGQTQKVKVFLIALNDNGLKGKAVGCGDSAVALEREVAPTKAVLKASIDELLSLKEKNYGESGLYNALAGSKLKADTVTIDEGGLTKIEITGNYKFVGVCEDARFLAQIEETARHFTSVREVEIYLNGKNLKNLYK